MYWQEYLMDKGWKIIFELSYYLIIIWIKIPFTCFIRYYFQHDQVQIVQGWGRSGSSGVKGSPVDKQYSGPRIKVGTMISWGKRVSYTGVAFL